MAQERIASILTIGTEIVDGDVCDINAWWLARRLPRLGFRVQYLVTARDDIGEIVDILRFVHARSQRVFVTGGLGATPDDQTREAVSNAFSRELLSCRLETQDRTQAPFEEVLLPAGARILENPVGGIAGFALEGTYVFPGAPSEMREIFRHITPELRVPQVSRVYTHTLDLACAESELVAVFDDFVRRYPSVQLGSYPDYTPKLPRVRIVLKSRDAELLAAATSWIQDRLVTGEWVLSR